MFFSCKKVVNQESNNKNLFNNDVLFSYDSKSQLTMNSFKSLSTITDLELTHAIKAIRKMKMNITLFIALKKTNWHMRYLDTVPILE